MRTRTTLSLSAVALLAFSGSALADAVLDWNQIALNTVASTSTPPPRAARNLAIMHAAVYDAVNAIERTNAPYLVNWAAPASTNKQAAAIVAASTALSQLYPAQAAAFTAQRDAQLALIPNSADKTTGINLGSAIANLCVQTRANDGNTNPSNITFTPVNAPGRYRAPADNPASAALPWYGTVTPFAVPSGQAFRPGPAPALNSPEYAAALNEVKVLGAATGSTRTSDQTSMARAWVFGAGTVTPPGAWNQLATQIAGNTNTIGQNARMFAMLNVALADAGICAWDCKYAQDFWRPIDAIRQADLDGNAATSPDAAWLPLLSPTPNHPTYVSGHSTFSRAGATVLQAFLGTDAINVNFAGDLGEFRMLTSLNQAADEGGLSRIYGGIHFSFDNVAGQQIGFDVGNYVAANFFGAIPTPGAAGLLAGAALLAARRRR